MFYPAERKTDSKISFERFLRREFNIDPIGVQPSDQKKFIQERRDKYDDGTEIEHRTGKSRATTYRCSDEKHK